MTIVYFLAGLCLLILGYSIGFANGVRRVIEQSIEMIKKGEESNKENDKRDNEI